MLIFNILIPILLLVTLSLAHPIGGESYRGPVKTDVEDVYDPGSESRCLRNGFCNLDVKLFKKMCDIPLIGPLFNFLLSDDNKNQTYFIVGAITWLLGF